MERLDRHDRVMISRRKRLRARVNRPRPWLWLSQGIIAALLVIFLSVGLTAGVGLAAVYGIYTSYAAQLPDASIIEAEQDEFQTVRIYDRTGNYLLYESVDPRPFRGDRTYVPLAEMSPWVARRGGIGGSQLLGTPWDKRARSAARFHLQLAGRRGAGRFVDHPAVDQERGDPD